MLLTTTHYCCLLLVLALCWCIGRGIMTRYSNAVVVVRFLRSDEYIVAVKTKRGLLLDFSKVHRSKPAVPVVAS